MEEITINEEQLNEWDMSCFVLLTNIYSLTKNINEVVIGNLYNKAATSILLHQIINLNNFYNKTFYLKTNLFNFLYWKIKLRKSIKLKFTVKKEVNIDCEKEILNSFKHTTTDALYLVNLLYYEKGKNK